MKSNKPLTELSLAELLEKKKKSKAAALGLGIVMLIANIISISLAIKNNNFALIGVAIGSSLTLLPLVMSLKQIDEEIKKREQQ